MTNNPARRLGRNSLFSLIRSVVTLPVMLLLTPYTLAAIGKEAFGIWALVGVVTSYAQLSDFGISETLVKYVAEYAAQRDDTRLNRLLGTALSAYLVLALVIGSLFFAVVPWLAGDLLLIPAAHLNEAVAVLRLATAIFFVNMICGVFSSVLIGCQRHDLSTIVHLVSLLLTAGGTVVALEGGWGVRGLVLTNAGVTLVAAGLQLLLARRLFPALSLAGWRWYEREMLGRIFSYSWKVQLTNLSQLLVFQIDRVLISRYLGLEAVALYEVGNRAASYGRAFIVALFTPLIPAASDLAARNEQSLLAGLYRRAFKFMALAALPVGALTVALAGPLVELWMGPGFELAALTLQLLLPAYLVNVFTGPGYFILNGINRPEVGMRSALLAGGLNLVLCTVLVQSHGYFGLIGGMMIALTVSAAYFFVLLHRALPGLEWSLYPPLVVRPLVVALPLALLAALTSAWLATVGAGFWRLVPVTLGYALAVGAALLPGDYLDDFEKEVVRSVFARRDRKA